MTALDSDVLKRAIATLAAMGDEPGELVNAAGVALPVSTEEPGRPSLLAASGRLSVAPGQTISSAWGNTLWDQSVQQFASAADRDTQFPAPKDGAVCYLLDAQTLWVRRAGAWKGLPMGLVAEAVGPAASMNAASNNAVTLTATVQAGRKYRVSALGIGTQQTAAGTMLFTLQGPIDSGYPRFGQANGAQAGWVACATAVFPVSPSVTGPQTWTLQISTTGGTIAVSVNYCHIILEDMGS